MAKRPELMVMSGELSGRRFAVPQAGLRVGRSSSNDLFIPDEELSRNHCLVDWQGEDGIRIMDLASANGTIVNGESLESEPRPLKVGDVIEIGATVINVVGDGPVVPQAAPVVAAAGGAVDLGLGTVPAKVGEAAAGAPGAKRSPLAGILWGVVAVAVLAAIVAVLCVPSSSPSVTPSSVAMEAKRPGLTSLTYEKVEADATRIFRYQMTVDESGELRVIYDDVPEADRHVDKRMRLSDRAKARILEILDTKGWEELEEVYSGASAMDENALKSWRIHTIRGTVVRDILVENTPEPEVFQQVREALETLSRNELGIWAIQYSREQLLQLSGESAKVGDAKWEEREVEYGNLSEAVDAYKEALFYLETVNPKPEGYAELKEKQTKAVAELERRYKDQRFLADKAINLGDWETAKTELRILCDLVPNKADPRHGEATAKLVDVENRMKKAKKGGR